MTSLDITLNDLAVIRTTFETMEIFPEDEALRLEMIGIIADARACLTLHLQELSSNLSEAQTEELQLERFREQILRMVARGMDRGWLDRLMKVTLFTSVGEEEAARTGEPFEAKFRYEFLPELELPQLHSLSLPAFVDRVVQDLRQAVTDDPNYVSKFLFEKYVFQKFVAVLFAICTMTAPRLDSPEYDQ